MSVCVIASLKQARESILLQITEIAAKPIDNNFTISLEGLSVTNGVDTVVQNLAGLTKQLKEIEELLVIYQPFEFHTVAGD